MLGQICRHCSTATILRCCAARAVAAAKQLINAHLKKVHLKKELYTIISGFTLFLWKHIFKLDINTTKDQLLWDIIEAVFRPEIFRVLGFHKRLDDKNVYM